MFSSIFSPWEPVKATSPPKLSTNPVQHTDNFKIVVILDESGSMNIVREKMISALNDLVLEQQQIKSRPCSFTLVKFNDIVKRVIENRDLREINKLTYEDYTPDRTTALFDAIGETIDWFKYERDVLMVIITDGQENASKHFTKTQVTDMLQEKQKYCNWSYVYLCNDLSTASQGNSIGLNNSKFSANCVVDQTNYGSFIKNKLNSAISNYRQYGTSVQSQLK